MRLLLVVLLALSATAAHAQVTCSTINSQATCYANRADCRYVDGACVAGAPTTCEQYQLDTVGCTAVAGCAVNSASNQCFETLPICTSLTQTQCNQRSDCNYAGSCLVGAAAGTCGSFTTGATCKAAQCYWDDYYPTGARCLYNVQEVNLQYSCATWSNYPNVANACGAHGCGATGNRCDTVDSGMLTVDSGYSLSARIHYSTAAIEVAPNSLTYAMKVLFAMSDFFQPSAPVYTSLVLGVPSMPSAIQSGTCTSVLAQPGLGVPILPSAYLSQPELTARFMDRLTTNRDMTFANGDALDAAVIGVLSEWRIGGSSIVETVDLVGGTTVSAQLRFDLSWCVAHCGCSQQVYPTYTQYKVPFGVVARTNGDNIAASMREVAVTIYTYGSIQVSGNSNNPFTAVFSDVRNSGAACPAGQQQLKWTVDATFARAYDSTRLVGLRSLTDVSMTSPASTALTNCFGTQPTEVIPPTSCTGGLCTTRIKFATRCTPIGGDGQSLRQCSAQTAANRIADMGSDIPYPGFLNEAQSFFMYPKSWVAADGSGVVAVGQDSTGAIPDQVYVTMSVDVFPEGSTSLSLEVESGFASIPDGVLPGDFTLASDPRNKQLYFSRTITPLIKFPVQSELETFVLAIDTSTVRVYPLSSTGEQLGTAYLTWTDLAPIASRSPRLDVCATCSRPGIVTYQGLIGLDAFSLPVTTLRLMLPGNGYRFEFYWHATLPNPAPVVGGRRLLAVNESLAEGLVSMLMYLPQEEQTASLDWDQGKASDAAWVAFGSVLGGVVGTMGAAALVVKLGFTAI